MGFGKTGSQIIRENIGTGDGDVNIMIPGRKANAIFLTCKILCYAEICDSLEEDCLIFTNKVIRILHDCCTLWSGSPINNDGDSYMMIWKLPGLGF